MSRQRELQKRWRAEGRCIICGKEALPSARKGGDGKSSHCAWHHLQLREKARARLGCIKRIKAYSYNLTKFCTQCQAHKPISEFNRRRASPDGLRRICRTCQASYARTYKQRGQRRMRDVRGERNGRAKLTPDDVRQIRHKAEALGMTIETLAGLYNVSVANISMIINRRSWRHVK